MAINPKSLQNLKKMKKGETRNPNGAPVRKGISLVNRELEELGYAPATKTDIEVNYLSMLQLSQNKLTELANDKDKPMLVRIIAKNMLGNKGFDIIERMLDRSIGKAKQAIEADVKMEGEIKIII